MDLGTLFITILIAVALVAAVYAFIAVLLFPEDDL